MRDRFLQRFARLHRRPSSDTVAGTDVIPTHLESQVQRVFPRPDVSDVLRSRVAHICAEAVDPAPSGSARPAWNRRRSMSTVRWALLGVAAAGLAVAWRGDQPGAEALAATVRAMEAVPVIHVISRGDKGYWGETWIVNGVGMAMHSREHELETVIVDDLKNEYRYYIPSPTNIGISEPRVQVMPSQLADPKRKAAIWNGFSLPDRLKELQSGTARGAAQMSWVTRGGRRLLRVFVSGSGWRTTFYSDGRTGRIQSIEEQGPSVRGNAQIIRSVLDYPSLASVDRSRLRFAVPDAVVVWDQTEAPTHWARGDAAICLDRMKALREALRRYGNDNEGQWPEALRPALESYVRSPETFHCPLAPGTSYTYHRPGELLGARTLEAWNRRKADPFGLSDAKLSGARPPVLECRHPGGEVFSLLAHGEIHRWYQKSDAAAPASASAAPAVPQPVDPQAMSILKALGKCEQRLSEVKVIYDFYATRLMPLEIPRMRSRPSFKVPAGVSMDARITWARKGPKMLRDEQSRLPGGLARQRFITDGDVLLMQYVQKPGEPLSGPIAQGSAEGGLPGAVEVGLALPTAPLAELLAGKQEVHYLGRRPVGRDECEVLEVINRQHDGSRTRLWLDPARGYLLRRAEERRNERLSSETTTSQPREWAPGVFLPTRLTRIGYQPESRKPTTPAHRSTTLIRDVLVGDLPDSLFQPARVDRAKARPGAAPQKHAKRYGQDTAP
jgi:hypothetical protein